MSNPAETLTFRISGNAKAQIKAAAAERGCTISQLVGDLVEQVFCDERVVVKLNATSHVALEEYAAKFSTTIEGTAQQLLELVVRASDIDGVIRHNLSIPDFVGEVRRWAANHYRHLMATSGCSKSSLEFTSDEGMFEVYSHFVEAIRHKHGSLNPDGTVPRYAFAKASVVDGHGIDDGKWPVSIVAAKQMRIPLEGA